MQAANIGNAIVLASREIYGGRTSRAHHRKPDVNTNYKTFHRVVSAIRSNSLVQNDQLRTGLFFSVGPGIKVHSNDVPDLEKLRSLVLDFRKLIADREPSFLNRIHNLAMQDPSLTDEQRDRVKAARAKFHAELDRQVDMWTELPGQPRPTIRRVLDDWINGGLTASGFIAIPTAKRPGGSTSFHRTIDHGSRSGAARRNQCRD
jgi:hypothetical protein